MLKMTDFVLKTMDFTLKLMGFARNVRSGDAFLAL